MRRALLLTITLCACGPAPTVHAVDFCGSEPACAPDGLISELQRFAETAVTCDLSSAESPVMRRYSSVTVTLAGTPSLFDIHFALAGDGPSTDSYAFQVGLNDPRQVTVDTLSPWKSWQYQSDSKKGDSLYLSEDASAHFYFSSLDSRGGLRVTCSN